MENKATNLPSESIPQPSPRNTRRRNRARENESVRFFLPKPGSAPSKPELGQEMQSEGEALIEALKSGQPFYMVTAWKAVANANGNANPIIEKEAVVQT